MSFIKADNRTIGLIALAVSIAALGFSVTTSSKFATKQVKVETINISRIVNAERASVAGIIKGNVPAIPPKAFVAQLKATILGVAGPQTIVIVRQALVAPGQSGIADITDQVIKKLGLPDTKASSPAPLNHAGQALGDTGFGQSQMYKNFNARQSALAQQILAKAKKAKADNIAP